MIAHREGSCRGERALSAAMPSMRLAVVATILSTGTCSSSSCRVVLVLVVVVVVIVMGGGGVVATDIRVVFIIWVCVAVVATAGIVIIIVVTMIISCNFMSIVAIGATFRVLLRVVALLCAIVGLVELVEALATDHASARISILIVR